MSIYHSKKCDKETVEKFKLTVSSWFLKNNIQFSKMIALTGYDGEVRVYRGTETQRLSKRKVLQKDAMGYFRAKTIVIEKDYFPFYREEWESDISKDSDMLPSILAFFKN